MQRRKDNKGRVLKDGEVYRKSDGLYMYRWTAKNGKRHTIYDAVSYTHLDACQHSQPQCAQSRNDNKLQAEQAVNSLNGRQIDLSLIHI